MDEAEAAFMKVAMPAMTDRTLLQIGISVGDAWFLVCALQFATRHPGLDPEMKQIITSAGRQFQAAIVERHPATAEALEMGWDPQFDKPPEKK